MDYRDKYCGQDVLRQRGAEYRKNVLSGAEQADLQQKLLTALETCIQYQQDIKEILLKGVRKFRWMCHKRKIMDLSVPTLKADMPEDGKRHFTIICHDQQIDRRILQQASLLTRRGWSGVIVCLSPDAEDHLEKAENYQIHRIGLKHIIPNNSVYWAYHKAAYLLGSTWFDCKLTRRLLFRLYQIGNIMYYRCLQIMDPLPFDRAFTAAASLYPAELVIGEDLPALGAAVTLARTWRSKVIFDSHEFYPEQRVFSAKQKKIMHRYTGEYIGQCDAVITVSDGIAGKFAEYYGIKRPLVLHNVTGRATSTEAGGKLRETLRLDPAQKIILYQGGIIPERNIENLVAGFVRLDPADTHLVLLGPSDPKFLRLLQKRAGRLKDKKIHFLEAVPQQELLSYTASADFGVVPYKVIDLNTRYCIPNKFFEYIQAGLPVLTNELTEVGKILRNIGGGGMVADLNTPVGAARAIRTMLQRDLKHDREALKAAQERYSWEFEGEMFMDLVDHLQ